MKRLTLLPFLILVLFIFTGCADNSDEESTADLTENSSAEESEDENTSKSESEDSDTDDESDVTSEASTNTNSESTASEGSNSSEANEEEEILSAYSSELIEYARIWSQLGPNPNQELDILYALHIPAGKPINPNDDTSANYPEDVIQLAGTRLVDGSVTYSGNGDGTINVYNVPLRWENNVPEDLDENFMSDYTQSIIEETELVYIEPESTQKIIDLIEIIEIHN